MLKNISQAIRNNPGKALMGGAAIGAAAHAVRNPKDPTGVRKLLDASSALTSNKYAHCISDNFYEVFFKTAATRSEIVFSALNPLNLLGGSVIGGAIGLLRKPYTDKELEEVNKKSTSNILIPGLAPYRFARRLNTLGMSKKERD
jgi:hypothetical protein